MTYRPKTTPEQRAEVLIDLEYQVSDEAYGVLSTAFRDLEQAEKTIDELRLQLDNQDLHYGEPAYQIGEGCLHPNAEWDTERVRPARVCTICGEDVGRE